MQAPAPGGDPGRAVERSDTSKSTAPEARNPLRRTRSQDFADQQLLAAIEHHGGKLYIMATDWGTWRDKWFITPRRAAEAAFRLAADGVLQIERLPAMVVVTRAGR